MAGSRRSCNGLSRHVTKTSAVRTSGAGGGSRCRRRHTVKMKSAMLTKPNVSATTRVREKIGWSQFSELVHRQYIQYAAYAYATTAMTLMAVSCDSGSRGIVEAETPGASPSR